MKKALITGTQGFIGKNLKESIQDEFEIFEIDEDIFNSDTWYDTLFLYLTLVNPNVIYHIGACSDTLEQNVNYMMTRNYESTKIISDWCLNNKVPLIYSSSAANYGENNKYPSNLYGWSKYVAEKYVIMNGGIGLRYFNVYGPKEENKGKMSSVAYQMFIKQRNEEEIKLFPLKPSRDFVYVKDIISANLYAYSNYEKLGGNYYDVGSGESKTFEDVLDIMGIKYGYHDESSIPLGYQFYTCSNKEKWMTGWSPNFNLKNGLADYIKYLINNV